TQTNLGPPDIDLTLQQHDAYIAAMHACQLEVTVLPSDERFPDGHFVEDAAIIFRDMAFVCRSGALSRVGEAEEMAQHLSHLQQIHIQGDEGLLDGGDVLFCADRVLIGLSERTNRAGAEQLASALRSVQGDLRVDIVTFSGMLHLKSGLTELAPGVLALASAMQPDYDLSFAEVFILPPEETYAANLVPINDTLLVAAGFPTVLSFAERYYNNIIQLEMSEFEKMDGGLSCLSLRY
ncbi:arginine deiminase family protein, partial [Chloroflexota bacterium]